MTTTIARLRAVADLMEQKLQDHTDHSVVIGVKLEGYVRGGKPTVRLRPAYFRMLFAGHTVQIEPPFSPVTKYVDLYVDLPDGTRVAASVLVSTVVEQKPCEVPDSLALPGNGFSFAPSPLMTVCGEDGGAA